MTNYEKIISKSPEELAKWLDELTREDETPWYIWLNTTHCQKCKPISVTTEGYGDDEVYPCELQDAETGSFTDPCGYANYNPAKLVTDWLNLESE